MINNDIVLKSDLIQSDCSIDANIVQFLIFKKFIRNLLIDGPVAISIHFECLFFKLSVWSAIKVFLKKLDQFDPMHYEPHGKKANSVCCVCKYSVLKVYRYILSNFERNGWKLNHTYSCLFHSLFLWVISSLFENNLIDKMIQLLRGLMI